MIAPTVLRFQSTSFARGIASRSRTILAAAGCGGAMAKACSWARGGGCSVLAVGVQCNAGAGSVGVDDAVEGECNDKEESSHVTATPL